MAELLMNFAIVLLIASGLVALMALIADLLEG